MVKSVKTARPGHPARNHEPSRDKHRHRAQKKRRPLEVSSKAPVDAPKDFSRLTAGESKARDPRFSDLSGKYNPDLFAKSYSFLNEMFRLEKQGVAQQLAQTRNLPPHKREHLKRKMDAMNSIEKIRKHSSEERELKQSLISQEKEKIVQFGKLPYLRSRSQLHKILREKKLAELQKRPEKLNKHLIRKSKRGKKTAKEFMEQMQATPDRYQDSVR